jgi:DNA polymerase-3 subunit alpha
VSFVHLHVHSSFSVLDGLASPADLVKHAKELGMNALALTDHGTMFGTLDFFKTAKSEGIKPIIGLEAYVAPRSMLDKDVSKDKKAYHLVLLAKNMTGYKNLLKIASVSQLEGFYYHPRIDKAYLAEHTEGLIGLSACLAGEIPRALNDNDLAKAESSLNWYKEAFEPGNFYLELQDHNIPELFRVNRLMVELAKRTNTPLVATNDVHYARKEDADLQDILLCIQTGKLLSDTNRMRMSDDSYYLRSPQEMQSIFSQVPEALSNTELIAEQCEIDLTRSSYHLPKFEVPEGENAESFLLDLCQEGLHKNIPDRADSPEIQERLKYELGVINQMGFAEYFLIVWDLCRFSREESIWYNVRGSGNGSLVAFALDITSVEPLSYHLLFERFLNPDRVTMPDIDLDFQDDRRAEVMEYCNRKYGADKVSQIITFGTMAARGAVRDVGRVMNIPLVEVDRVAKAVPGPVQGKNVPLAKSLETTPELKELYESNEQYKRLIDVAGRMEGSIRNVGTHAAGVIISDLPLTEYLPLHRPTNQNDELPIKSVAQYDMSGINDLGLLKVDFLGLTTLTIMAKACEYIEQRHGVKLTLSNIPIDDPKVYDYIGEGHTAGLFQLEGGGMTRYLVQMQPKTVRHVIAMVALYRPGPMESIPNYIANMKGEVPVNYLHEKLEPILEETYGHTVYQEQIMQAAMQLAGYTPGESDELRSAVSKKNAAKVKKHRSKFVEGAVKNGIEETTANLIFDHWEAFASYGFNKSHATNYGMMAVKTAHLKYHYPVEYMTALLSAWKSDNEKCALYIAECRDMGIEVLPPDVNSSGYDFTIEDRSNGTSAIRFGLGAVKNVGQAPVEEIIRGREEGSDGMSRVFTSLNDFVQRVDLRKVSKRPLECLIKVGALDQLGERGSMLASVDQIVNVSASHFKAKEMGQMDLFGGFVVEETPLLVLQSQSTMSKKDQLDWEKELLGLYISDHPLNAYLRQVEDKISHNSNTLLESDENGRVTVGGVVNRLRPIRTKKDAMMAFVTLSDAFGDMDLVFFPKTWEQYQQIIDIGAALLVDGKAQHREGKVSILVDKASAVESAEQAENNDPLSGPFYELTLERNLPDMRLLSRYAWPPVQDESGTTEEEPVEALENGDIEHNYWDDEPEFMEDTAFEKKVIEQTFVEETLTTEEILIVETESDTTGITNLSEVEKLEDDAKGEEIEYVDEEVLSQLPSQILVLTLQPCDSPEKDQRRLSKYYGWLCAHPGRDLFGFRLMGSDGWRVVYYPNFPIEISEPMIKKLEDDLGKENVTCQLYSANLTF